jgi:hypothetical protein
MSNGEIPSLIALSTSAPYIANNLTILIWPFSEAIYNGVIPLSLALFTLLT